MLTDAPYRGKTAIPTKVGDPSPIKHVLYIIKENRTYDQVFGDMPRGNGDPSLVMFGEDVTPNHHKLAEEFVLLDNLYCNGHVSADGHPWSTMAYNTDYIARNWALTYSSRPGIDDDDEGDLTNAPSRLSLGRLRGAGLTYRNYGEYGRRVSQPDGTFKIEGAVPGPGRPHVPRLRHPKVRGRPCATPTTPRRSSREFREFEKNGDLPRLMIMSLGEDHTTGTRPGTLRPRACVASNDLALGRIVEAVTQSKFWPETAIFVIEDDAQNGPDHVDAHRTVGLVISPYTKRKHLDSTQYSTVSMIRTMELILGLPPLTPVRRGGPADVRLVHRPGRPRAVHPRAGPDRPERGRTPPRPMAPIGRPGWTSTSTTGSTTSSSTRSSGGRSRGRTPRSPRPSGGRSPTGRPPRRSRRAERVESFFPLRSTGRRDGLHGRE